MTDGDWSSHTDFSDPTRRVTLWTIRIGSVFEGEVLLEARGNDRKEYWWARVNNHSLGGVRGASPQRSRTSPVANLRIPGTDQSQVNAVHLGIAQPSQTDPFSRFPENCVGPDVSAEG